MVTLDTTSNEGSAVGVVDSSPAASGEGAVGVVDSSSPAAGDEVGTTSLFSSASTFFSKVSS